MAGNDIHEINVRAATGLYISVVAELHVAFCTNTQSLGLTWCWNCLISVLSDRGRPLSGRGWLLFISWGGAGLGRTLLHTSNEEETRGGGGAVAGMSFTARYMYVTSSNTLPGPAITIQSHKPYLLHVRKDKHFPH